MIYINARFFSQKLTGVQRFAINISIALSKLRDDVCFLAPPDITENDTTLKLKILKIGKRSGPLWEQIDLPLFLKKRSNPLLINLGSTAPIFYKNQIVSHHDITFIKYPQSFSKSFRAYYSFLVPKMLKKSKLFITVSEFSKKEISGYFNYPAKKIHVIPNAIDQKFHPAPIKTKNKKKYLLAVSSPNYHKNFERMIEAFFLADLGDSIELKIVGSQESNFTRSDLMTKMTDNPGIKFLGHISDDQLISLYQNASVFIFPSLYEGFGIPPLEAQACGCPVISSNRASMPEVLKDSVLYFDPEDVNAISTLIKVVLNEHKVSANLIEAGIKNASRYSWIDSASKLNNLINDINSEESILEGIS
ncbi:MAG: glycosyltransferase family 1 protein [Mucilaginibacter sp.]